MKLFNKTDYIGNIFNEYYKTKKNHLEQNIPPLQLDNSIGIGKTTGKRLLLNTAFTCGVVVMCGLFILTIGNQSKLEIAMGKIIENTNAIEHIRSGAIFMFEILNKSFM